MEICMNLRYHRHEENYNSLTKINLGGHLKLIGTGVKEESSIDRTILVATSSFLRTTMEGIAISELDAIILPDFNNRTIKLTIAYLHTGSVVCSAQDYVAIVELLDLLGIGCFEYSEENWGDLVVENFPSNNCEVIEVGVSAEQPPLYDLSEDEYDNDDDLVSEYFGSKNAVLHGGFDGAIFEYLPEIDLEGDLSAAEKESVVALNSTKDHTVADVNGNPSTPVLDQVFACSVCSQYFSTRSYLEIHMKLHTNTGDQSLISTVRKRLRKRLGVARRFTGAKRRRMCNHRNARKLNSSTDSGSGSTSANHHDPAAQGGGNCRCRFCDHHILKKSAAQQGSARVHSQPKPPVKQGTAQVRSQPKPSS